MYDVSTELMHLYLLTRTRVLVTPIVTVPLPVTNVIPPNALLVVMATELLRPTIVTCCDVMITWHHVIIIIWWRHVIWWYRTGWRWHHWEGVLDTMYCIYVNHLVCNRHTSQTLPCSRIAGGRWTCNYTIYGHESSVYFRIWYNHRDTARLLFMCEV